MIKRNWQSLVILAEESAIPAVGVSLAEAVVRRMPDAIEGILRSVKACWEKRLKQANKIRAVRPATTKAPKVG
jgi:hypothetical protein